MRRPLLVAATVATIYVAVSMGPADTLTKNLQNWRELRFVHALCWSHLLGVACDWCLAEAARLNAVPRPRRAARPVAEATLDLFDKRAPFVVRGALRGPAWTAASLAAMPGANATTYSFQCAANNNRLLRDFPALADAAGLDEPFLASLREGKFSLRGVFMGEWDGRADAAPSRGSSLHSDLSANWYAQLGGRKTWTLVDPTESARRLLPCFDERPGVPALFSGLGYGADAPPSATPLADVDRLVVTLDVGDLLYVPSWWWHQIENLPGFNAAVALRGPRSVVAALRPSAPAFFATVGSLPDIAVQTRNLLATRLGLRTGSFEDAFLKDAASRREL
ncbi:transcription factor jumonji [Aureococcus anophagefferens]|nr:transcription factor jumonji [Aureococcus anophagefferens]